MIEISGLSKIYHGDGGETHALSEVSFTIRHGEYVAIMGPSGSGKSTLMNIIGCLDTPTSGTYRFDGRDIGSCTDDELAELRRTKIGFVFQSFNLLPRTTVLRNVMLPLMYAHVPTQERHKRAQRALARAALPQQFHSFRPNQLSGGMMQRVAIARALANDPLLILADEPTGNLDTATGEQVLATFDELHAQEQRTIIMITHERQVACRAQRVITLRDGRII